MSDQYQHQTSDDIAERIGQLPAGILDIDEPEEAAPPKEDEAAPEGEENSTPEQEPETDKAGEEEEEKDKDKKPASEDDPDKDKPEAEEDDDPVYEVTLPDGETAEVPLSELAAGYLQSREVETIKAETAEQRRLYESRVQEIPHLVQQAVREKETELAQKIELYAQANPLGDPPPAHMLDPNHPDYNPDAYHYQMRQYEDRRQSMGAAAQELQKIARDREEQQRQHEAREREKLQEKWPELLSDSAKRDAFLKQVEAHYGLSRDEVAAFNDHRAFLVLRDAVGYREMKVKAPEVRQKAKAPKPKPVKPGQRKTDKDIQRADYADQRKRLKKTGRPEDAVDIFERMEI